MSAESTPPGSEVIWPRREGMSRWYGPRGILQMGVSLVISGTLGRRLDSRRIDALASSGTAYDVSEYADENGDFWMDYVADTGDGWNSTYAVASTVARRYLELSHDGTKYATRRGAVLVFGGDLAYPVPSRKAYDLRLVQVYEAALKESTPPNPVVFAIPGNHDWLDSLVAFTRLFAAHRWFAGWQTRQDRSYFAVRLPHGWWVIGTDIQLGADIDQPQLDYFRATAATMKPEDRIVLCTAEPHWIYGKLYGRKDPDATESNLAFLETHVFGRRIAVFLAGDLHHYQRHEQAPESGALHRRQKIVAGGGGAFLHPTHRLDTDPLADGFRLAKQFPPPSVSRRLSAGNLFFLFKNPEFAPGIGALYACCYLASEGAGWSASIRSPWVWLYSLGVLTLAVLFTRLRPSAKKSSAAILHGVGHVAAAVGCATLSRDLAGRLVADTGFETLTALFLSFVTGCIVGSTLFGMYLWAAYELFGEHLTEAYSSLRLEGWKCFLRFRIRRDGSLTIFPVGIAKVPRRWKEVPGGPVRDGERCARYEPVGRPLAPELIEEPVVLPFAEARSSTL